MTQISYLINLALPLPVIVLNHISGLILWLIFQERTPIELFYRNIWVCPNFPSIPGVWGYFYGVAILELAFGFGLSLGTYHSLHNMAPIYQSKCKDESVHAFAVLVT